MNTIPLPNYVELMTPLLKISAESEPQALALKQYLGLWRDEFGLSDDADYDQFRSEVTGRNLFYNNLAWAAHNLLRAGLMTKPKMGYFVISEEGKVLLAKLKADSNLTLSLPYLMANYPAFVAFRKNIKVPPVATMTTAPVDVNIDDNDDSTLEIQFRTLEKIQAMPPRDFEVLVGDVLEKMGYGKAEVTKYSGDNGVDVIINADRLGINQLYVQAKRYSDGNNVGLSDIKEFHSTIMTDGGKKGIFMITSEFTKEAKDHAKKSGIRLINGTELALLMIEYKEIDNDYFKKSDT